MKRHFLENGLKNKWMLGGLLSVSLLLSIPTATKAQISAADTGEFSRIEQPIGLKIGVATAGLGLVGLELWWFLFHRNAHTAQSADGIQSIDITVDGGYSPNHVVVQAGQPVRLKFLRKDPSGCLEQVILPDFNKARDLPLNQAVTIEILPKKAGRYRFHCGMNMFRGTITAKEDSSE